jgi:hypothetical protein
MRAFITGSRAYGNPRPNSDVDLVVLVDEDTADLLRTASETRGPVRFGRLNLVVCTTEEQYAVWRLGTSQMKTSLNKYTSKEAKALLDQLRLLVGINDGADSGHD